MSAATNLDRVEKIAEAVLYEGYILYPYRATAVKNQQRWNFGVLCPRSYSEQENNTEAWMMQTECLMQADSSSQLTVKVRFLQLINRSMGKVPYLLSEFSQDGEPEFEIVDRLEIGGRTFMPWQEAAEREITLPPLHSAANSAQPLLFEIPAGKEIESLRNEDGMIAGVCIREWEQLRGSVEVTAQACQDGVIKITIRVRNLTTSESPQEQTRNDALIYSFVSTHTILNVDNGDFVSLLDPPDDLKSLVAECSNVGTWPVLAGEEGDRHTMLSSPIILYDYPQIAPESPGSLFDGTEIDEILSLRILALTDEEKHEMRQSDERAREMLERIETMPPEQFMKLHGVLRELHPMHPETTRGAR